MWPELPHGAWSRTRARLVVLVRLPNHVRLQLVVGDDGGPPVQLVAGGRVADEVPPAGHEHVAGAHRHAHGVHREVELLHVHHVEGGSLPADKVALLEVPDGGGGGGVRGVFWSFFGHFLSHFGHFYHHYPTNIGIVRCTVSVATIVVVCAGGGSTFELQ